MMGDVERKHQIPAKLGGNIKTPIPPPKPKKKTGRLQMNNRKAMNAIFYVLPRWCGAILFEQMWKVGLIEYESEKKVDWAWQSLGGVITRGCLLTNGTGIPSLITVDGANRHDKKLAEGNLEAIVIERHISEEVKQNIPGIMARRWVVERLHSWLNRFWRLLTRWEKKAENCIAILHFACAGTTFGSAGLFRYVLRVR